MKNEEEKLAILARQCNYNNCMNCVLNYFPNLLVDLKIMFHRKKFDIEIFDKLWNVYVTIPLKAVPSFGNNTAPVFSYIFEKSFGTHFLVLPTNSLP